MMRQSTGFEGFLLGILALTLFVASQYGFSFTFIKPGNYVGLTGIYGVSALFALIYVSILLVLYEVLTNKSAFQSVAYTLLGYLFLDSIVQLKYALTIYYPLGLYGDTTLLNTFINFVGNMDVFCFILLAMCLSVLHISKYKSTLIDQRFHFGLNRLVFFFTSIGFLWYLIFLDHPISLYVPLLIYLLSSKRGDRQMERIFRIFLGLFNFL